PELVTEVARRGAVRAADLELLGIDIAPTPGVHVEGDWLVDARQWSGWVSALAEVVARHGATHRLDPGMPADEARHAIGVPDVRLVAPLASAAGLEQGAGRLLQPGAVPALGPGFVALAERLDGDAFSAPEQPDLEALGLGRREIAAAVSAGRLLRLRDEVLLLPDAPARAMRLLSGLPQPFTASAARQALGTTRRVAIPLLEHLDERGWTRRVDGSLREVVR
ncbi:MAG: translation elongation factor, partial [Frankiales bacterium]|nr:translation elongation factor [Frankiales bacterium]